MQNQSSQPPSSDDPDIHSPTTIRSGNKSEGIGGILIFVAIGLVLSLIQNIGHFQGSLAPFLQGQVWERLTTPGSTAYHPYWKPALLFKLAANSAILGLNAMTLVLFFRKQRVFPKVIVLGIPLIFILILISYYLSGLIPAVAGSPDYAKQKYALVVRFIALHVWIPYFLLSKRVKNTFVR